ncbi:hypothetical protein ACTXT7_011423 [Hymenolepis weldensis]
MDNNCAIAFANNRTRHDVGKNNQSGLLATALQSLDISTSIETSRSPSVQSPLGTADKGVAHNELQ